MDFVIHLTGHAIFFVYRYFFKNINKGKEDE